MNYPTDVIIVAPRGVSASKYPERLARLAREAAAAGVPILGLASKREGTGIAGAISAEAVEMGLDWLKESEAALIATLFEAKDSLNQIIYNLLEGASLETILCA